MVFMAATASGTDLFSLRGKTYLVAGGTRGIGQAISLRFAQAGATVIASYLRNEQAAEKLKAIATEEQLAISFCRADLTTDKGLEQLDQFLQQSGPQLSGLVYCAATGIHRSIDELTERHFDFIFNLNVRAFFRLIKLIKPRLSKGSSVVAVSSSGASRALPYYSLVGSSKGALDALARHLAAELASAGIRVNILTAGAVLTDAWKAMPNSEARLAETIRRTPAGRLVTAEEVAYGAQFLCSDAASGIVGHTLILDGGTAIMA
jgi:NAD(P)-dependent dehydrogenase (short-subunit alcohol dehydrogenase family)